jgi:hypothetical protein
VSHTSVARPRRQPVLDSWRRSTGVSSSKVVRSKGPAIRTLKPSNAGETGHFGTSWPAAPARSGGISTPFRIRRDQAMSITLCAGAPYALVSNRCGGPEVECGNLGSREFAGPKWPGVLRGFKRSYVMARLLVRAGSVVSLDRVVDTLWGASPLADDRRLQVSSSET